MTGREGSLQNIKGEILHRDTCVSMHRLEHLLGIRRLRPPSRKAMLERTEYIPGGICPFGLKAALSVFAQQAILDLPLGYINAGMFA